MEMSNQTAAREAQSVPLTSGEDVSGGGDDVECSDPWGKGGIEDGTIEGRDVYKLVDASIPSYRCQSISHIAAAI